MVGYTGYSDLCNTSTCKYLKLKAIREYKKGAETPMVFIVTNGYISRSLYFEV
jgi:hypothetical protein